MRVLVCVGSRHGATADIAEAVASRLRLATPTGGGFEVDVRDIGEAPDPVGYEGVVIGSAVYMGGWLRPARDFVKANSEALRGKAVWLFSSGPLGDPPTPAEPPTKVEELMRLSGARDHKVFSGKLDEAGLNVGERAVTRVVKAPEGDFRDWDEITAWAGEIASALRS